jgi:hypothetical protein
LQKCWRSIFLVLPKLDGCQVDLPTVGVAPTNYRLEDFLQIKGIKNGCMSSTFLLHIHVLLTFLLLTPSVSKHYSLRPEI